MNLDTFYNNTHGQSLLYPPNPEDLRGQCYQLYNFYSKQVWGRDPYWRENAYVLMDAPRDQYDVTINNPNDPNQIPQRGDVIVWDSTLPGSGGAGHVGIFWQNNGNHTFISYDSNWGGRTAHLVSHNWQYVAGWFRPKVVTLQVPSVFSSNITTGDEMITNEYQAHLAYKLLRPNGDGSPDEISGTAGKRSWASFADGAVDEMNQRDQNIAGQGAQLQNLQNTINQLNDTVTQLQTSGSTDHATIQSQVTTIADLTARLTTAHDSLADLQKRVTTATTIETVQNDLSGTNDVPAPTKKSTSSLVVKLIAGLINWRKKR